MDKRHTEMLDGYDTMTMARDTAKIAQGFVRKMIGNSKDDIDALTAISCILDRVDGQLQKAAKLLDGKWKAPKGG